MNEHVIGSVVTVATAIVGVAIIAVLVSSRANMAGVIQSAGAAFAQDLSAAVNPFSGAGGFTGQAPVFNLPN